MDSESSSSFAASGSILHIRANMSALQTSANGSASCMGLCPVSSGGSNDNADGENKGRGQADQVVQGHASGSVALSDKADNVDNADDGSDGSDGAGSELSFQANAASIQQRLNRADMGLALNHLVNDARRHEEFPRLKQIASLISKVAQDALAAGGEATCAESVQVVLACSGLLEVGESESVSGYSVVNVEHGSGPKADPEVTPEAAPEESNAAKSKKKELRRLRQKRHRWNRASMNSLNHSHLDSLD